jgi:hypothetical protein
MYESEVDALRIESYKNHPLIGKKDTTTKKNMEEHCTGYVKRNKHTDLCMYAHWDDYVFDGSSKCTRNCAYMGGKCILLNGK